MLPGRTEDAVNIRWKSLCRQRRIDRTLNCSVNSFSHPAASTTATAQRHDGSMGVQQVTNALLKMNDNTTSPAPFAYSVNPPFKPVAAFAQKLRGPSSIVVSPTAAATTAARQQIMVHVHRPLGDVKLKMDNPGIALMDF